MNVIAQRARQRMSQGGPRTPKMHAGACSGTCGCNDACPPGAGPFSIEDIARQQGRGVPGALGACKGNMLVLETLALAGGDTITITENAIESLCVDSVIVVARESATPFALDNVFLSNFTIANNPQWVMGREYWSGLFHPDARCSCCIRNDCIKAGLPFSVTVRNPGADDLDVRVYFKGPSVG